MAMASSPGRSCEESATGAAGRFAALTRSSARSRRVSREATAASNSWPSQSCTRICEERATCALVMMAPSADQMTPEPLPRAPERTRTVERRSCSAISPKPGIAMLFASARTFADHDVHLLRGAAADELEGDRLADGFAVELGVDVFEARDGMASESDENVAYDDAGFVRGAFRLDLENDGGRFFGALQRLPQIFREAHRLQADTQIALRDVPFFQQGVDDAVYGRCGDGDGSKAREARRGDADDEALRVNDRAADGRGLQADVETDVGREGRAGPGAALGRDQTDDTESRDRAARARASHHEREAPGLEGCRVAKRGDGGGSFRSEE